MVNYEELWKAVLERYDYYLCERDGFRNGQALFNALYDVDPDLANKLRSTHVDCFHQDRLMPKFIGSIFINWMEIK